MSCWLILLGNASFALSAISLFARDILILRIISIGSCIAGLTYNCVAPHGPFWQPIVWLTFFTVINMVQIVIIFTERRPHHLSEEAAELHEAVFPMFTSVEFLKLFRIGTWRTIAPGTVLGLEGDNPKDIFVIAHGRVAAEHGGRVVKILGDGSMIGEMALITDTPFRATLRADTELRCYAWSRPDLMNLFARNPLIALAMQRAFVRSIAIDMAASYTAGVDQLIAGIDSADRISR